MNIVNESLEKKILILISSIFSIWGITFIYNSSFVAVDGKRYFCLFDDAMISMRYAWNFSHGLGLVWNQDEYIQGYTNLLMTLLMSFATLIFDKSDAVLSIQILGLVFILLIAFFSMKIFNKMYPVSNHQSLFRLIIFFCVLSYYPLAYWSLMGMETGLLTLLLVLATNAALSYGKFKKKGYLILVLVFLTLAFYTRNDSFIFSALIWTYIIYKNISKEGIDNKAAIHVIIAVSLHFVFIAGQLIFQYQYYGEMFPNTHTLKLTGMPLSERIINGLGFIKLFLNDSAFILILSVISLAFNSKDEKDEKILFVAIGFSAIAYQIFIGGEPWQYWRLMSPTMPLLIILSVVTIANIFVLFLSSINADIHRKAIFIVLLSVLGILSSNIGFVPEIFFIKKSVYILENKANIDTAVVLN